MAGSTSCCIQSAQLIKSPSFYITSFYEKVLCSQVWSCNYGEVVRLCSYTSKVTYQYSVFSYLPFCRSVYAYIIKGLKNTVTVLCQWDVPGKQIIVYWMPYMHAIF